MGSCQIFASDTLAGKFRRQFTAEWEWDKAEGVAAQWQETGSWPNGSKPPAAYFNPKTEAPEGPAPQPMRKTVHEVVEAYLSARKSREIQTSTLTKYKTLTNQLEKYCNQRGYIFELHPSV